jgi:hypothetical protein
MGYIKIYEFIYICLITEVKPVGEIISDQEIFFIERVKLIPVIVRSNV